MVNNLDHVFHALAHPVRRTLVRRLGHGERAVTAISADLGMSKPAISKHLKVLEGSGMISRRIEGRRHLLRVEPAALAEAQRWIDEQRQFWERSLDSLERYLDEQPEIEEERES